MAAGELDAASVLAEMLPDGVVIAGPDAHVVFANGEACRLLGREPAEILERDIRTALPFAEPAGRPWWPRSDPWSPECTAAGHREVLLAVPGGHEVHVTARYVRSSDDGRVVRVVLGLRGSDARLRVEREQATVLTTVAHELRAPLTSVTGFTSSLLRRWDRFTDEQKRLMIETIESDANRLTRLIGELLDISRLDSGHLRLRLGPVDLEALLEGHVVRHELGRAPGSVRLALGPRAQEQGLPDLWADKDRLEQVFFNLVDNALQHGSAPVTVVVDRRDDDVEGAVVTVEDSGEGVPPQIREYIFDRFWRGPSSLSTGLGLYVVRGLVEAHGGEVTVESPPQGGARFVVRLPAQLPEHLRA